MDDVGLFLIISCRRRSLNYVARRASMLHETPYARYRISRPIYSLSERALTNPLTAWRRSVLHQRDASEFEYRGIVIVARMSLIETRRNKQYSLASSSTMTYFLLKWHEMAVRGARQAW